MNLLLQLLGAALVCLALTDVYLTVLVARSGTGLLSPRLHRGVWMGLCAVARMTPVARNRLLPHGGPSLLVLNLLLWSALLVCGFALIVWPVLGSAIQASGSRPTPRTFGAALYFAAQSLTTLGTGDLVPRTDLFRLLMVLQAGIGFSFLTLTLTYFMSIYNALQRRNRFALMLYHRTADTGDAAELVVRLVSGDRSSAVREQLAEIESGLDDLYESHHFYSILHYFYFAAPHYAMARMLLIALDTVTLIRSALHQEEYEDLIGSSAVEGLWRNGTYVLMNLGDTLLPRGERSRAAADEDEEVAAWEARYRRAVERFQAAGLPVNDDPDAGLRRYVELRREWNSAVRAFNRYTGRDWSEVAVAPVSEINRTRRHSRAGVSA